MPGQWSSYLMMDSGESEAVEMVDEGLASPESYPHGQYEALMAEF